MALKRRLSWAALVLGAAAIGIWTFVGASRRTALPVYWPAPEFALVNQAGDTVRTRDLRGTAWVVQFFFTHCTGVCPVITPKMARLRDSLAAAGLLGREVRLVSITVDPARDTPEVLRRYAERFGGSPPAEWAFLAGTPPEGVRRMIQRGFRVTAAFTEARTDSTANYQVDHSPRIMLVDRAGQVRGIYDASEAGALDRVTADLGALLEE